ncbi:hypothetical protein L596_030439 [Steinernema carpocapsae]|uniref:SXP/RAL-2 family protein Ani s 5-like cation-binding domain-containing protein n=1 Tax=Steinernema carpocapsae TaxID=34508 RepID=A0A4V5ZWY7_STECR|nr:hypothetical protein L596_030439 [Steinernema carpocapsae]
MSTSLKMVFFVTFMCFAMTTADENEIGDVLKKTGTEEAANTAIKAVGTASASVLPSQITNAGINGAQNGPKSGDVFDIFWFLSNILASFLPSDMVASGVNGAQNPIIHS